MGSEAATRLFFVTVVTAIVAGLCCLVPHLRAETYSPVLLQPGESRTAASAFSVAVTGDVAYPGLYSVDGDTGLSELLSLAGAAPDSPAPSLSITVAPARDNESPQKVNINRAETWLLDALPGIGPDRAQAIVDFRLEHGDFARIEDLKLVPGIGSAMYESLKDFITVAE